ncbi:MAG: LptF/LptG family permease [Candidatus Omnitrophica bacterium]|nr:LptF/LptG family permease [Candidatus Omnitrophota bacterium]
MNWILNRYITKEFTAAFFLSIAIFTFALLVGNFIKMADLIINRGVALTSLLKLIFYLIPYLLTYTVPMAMLTATLISFGRLSSDNEIMAMRSLGISLLTISLPLLVLGIIISVASIPLNDKLLTKSHFASRKVLREIGLRTPTAYLEAGTFIKDFDGYIVFIHEIKKNKLKNIRIYQPQENRPTRTITAKEGEFIPVPKKGIIKLKLIDGTSEEPDIKDPTRFFKLNFKTYYMTLNVQDKPRQKRLEKKTSEMTIKELKEESKKLAEEGIELEPLLTEIHKKIAISFSAFVFVLIAIPLAIKSNVSEKSISLGISIGVLVIYWLFLVGGTAFALRGILPPWFAIWLPNIVMGAAGVLLLNGVIKK